MGEYLKQEEFVNGKDGDIQFIKDGSVIPVLGSSKFSAVTTPDTGSRGQIGTRLKLTKIKGFTNKLTMSCDYYMVGIITEWLLEFKATGKWPKIDCMAVNHDKGTSLGRMAKIYKDLVPEGDIPLQTLDEASENGLMVDLTFNFSDWESLSNFSAPSGVGRE